MANKILHYFFPPNSNSKNRNKVFLLFLFCFLVSVILGFVNGYYFGNSGYKLLKSSIDSDSTIINKNRKIDSLNLDADELKKYNQNLNADIDTLGSIINENLYNQIGGFSKTQLINLDNQLQAISVNPKSKLQNVKLTLLACIDRVKNAIENEESASSIVVPANDDKIGCNCKDLNATIKVLADTVYNLRNRNSKLTSQIGSTQAPPEPAVKNGSQASINDSLKNLATKIKNFKNKINKQRFPFPKNKVIELLTDNGL